MHDFMNDRVDKLAETQYGREKPKEQGLTYSHGPSWEIEHRGTVLRGNWGERLKIVGMQERLEHFLRQKLKRRRERLAKESVLSFWCRSTGRCFTGASGASLVLLVLHWRFTGASLVLLVLHCCFTGASLVLHWCFPGASLVLLVLFLVLPWCFWFFAWCLTGVSGAFPGA